MLRARSSLGFQDHSFFISLATCFISVLPTCMCIHCVYTWFTPDHKDQKRESKPGTGLTDISNSHVHVENWTQVSWRTVRVLHLLSHLSCFIICVFQNLDLFCFPSEGLTNVYVFFKKVWLSHIHEIILLYQFYYMQYIIAPAMSTCSWGQSSGCGNFLLKNLKDFIKH